MSNIQIPISDGLQKYHCRRQTITQNRFSGQFTSTEQFDYIAGETNWKQSTFPHAAAKVFGDGILCKHSRVTQLLPKIALLQEIAWRRKSFVALQHNTIHNINNWQRGG